MKKIILILSCFLITTSLIYSSEKNIFDIEKTNDLAAFRQNLTFKFNYLNNYEMRNNLKNFSLSSQQKQNLFLGLGIAGASTLGLSYISYFLTAIITAPVLGVVYDATDEAWILLGGIILSGFIPIIGPFIGAPLLGVMSTYPAMVPDEYENNPLMFYGGFIALSVVLGVFEIAGFALMLVGFIMHNKIKKRNVSFYTASDRKGNTKLGLRIKL